jgi:prepilin-type N-terminal cleavage/methylation domain-containing protein
MWRQRHPSQREKGFTIVELMIATSVFAVVLLVATLGILQITRVYFKGVTETTTQNVARSVMDTVAQAVQFSGGNVLPTIAGTATPTSPRAFCIGNQRFSYDLGYQLKDSSPNVTNHQAYHVLAVDNYAGCTQTAAQSLNTAALASGSRELISPNMRLTKFTVESQGDNLYKITIRIAYGDDDLLSNPTDPNAICKGVRAGTQFCSISELSTIVVKRVQ